ncbi:MAG: hypothetical protein JKY50_12505 [Oleispira sp.]|nr:hypothetical protein [Oleispira sp.]
MSENLADNADSAPVELEQNIDENADSSTVETEQDAPDSVQQRINDISGQKNEAKAEADAMRIENESLRSRMAALENQPAPTFNDTGVPRQDNFEDYDEFQTANTVYQVQKSIHDQALASHAAQQVQIQQGHMNAQLAVHEQRKAVAATELKDMAQVLAGSQIRYDTQGGSAAGQALIGLDNSAQVEYHIAANPAVAAQLNASNPIQAAMMIQNISNGLTVKPKQQEALPETFQPAPSGNGKTSETQYQNLGGAKFW